MLRHNTQCEDGGEVAVETEVAGDGSAMPVEEEKGKLARDREEDVAESSTAPKRKKRRLFDPPRADTEGAQRAEDKQSTLPWVAKGVKKGKRVARYSFKKRDGLTAESAIDVDDL